MFFCTLNQRKGCCIDIGAYERVKVGLYIKVSGRCAQIQANDFNGKHEVLFLRCGHGDASRACHLLNFHGGGDAGSVDSADDHVGKTNDDNNDNANGKESPGDSMVLTIFLEA